jgi:glycerol-3-phosphate acyltransferase PlsX
MSEASIQYDTAARLITISVDAMGGDEGPAAIVAGIQKSAEKNADVRFLVFGPEAELKPLVEKRKLSGVCQIRDVSEVVSMEDKPSHVMRHGKGTSMWAAIDAVRDGEAEAVVSCGNTGALMAVSMVRLRKLPGIFRPAIACLWPSRNPGGFNVMLDVGADIRADAKDLLQYALMGGSYARNGLGLARPRVGLLNVEGGDIPSDRVDVIVTDGFTGNGALKTGEGTASLIREFLREAFRATFLSKFAALLAIGSLRRLSKRIDPRQVNGGVFLGLNGTVVKSHGSADATGVASALRLAYRLAESGFNERLAARVASFKSSGQDAAEKTAKAADKEQAK